MVLYGGCVGCCVPKDDHSCFYCSNVAAYMSTAIELPIDSYDFGDSTSKANSETTTILRFILQAVQAFFIAPTTPTMPTAGLFWNASSSQCLSAVASQDQGTLPPCRRQPNYRGPSVVGKGSCAGVAGCHTGLGDGCAKALAAALPFVIGCGADTDFGT